MIGVIIGFVIGIFVGGGVGILINTTKAKEA